MIPGLKNVCSEWRATHQPRSKKPKNAPRTEEDLAWDLIKAIEGAIQRLEEIQASTEVKAILERDFPPPYDQN